MNIYAVLLTIKGSLKFTSKEEIKTLLRPKKNAVVSGNSNSFSLEIVRSETLCRCTFKKMPLGRRHISVLGQVLDSDSLCLNVSFYSF